MVEGPLAGGHLGFGMDWAQYDLRTIIAEVLAYLKAENLDIPVIAAGGIFTGSDAAAFLEQGAAAVQVATRFTVTQECGLPDKVKQEYFKASEDDIEVNTISPTGYPMRMLKGSPGIGAGIRPNCEAYGYLLDANGNCAYIDAYNREVALHPDAKKISVKDKTCLCTHMRNFDIWTCGQYTYRLKDTTRAPAGRQLPAAQRRACVPRLPVQHRPEDRAAGLSGCNSSPSLACRRSVFQGVRRPPLFNKPLPVPPQTMALLPVQTMLCSLRVEGAPSAATCCQTFPAGSKA